MAPPTMTINKLTTSRMIFPIDHRRLLVATFGAAAPIYGFGALGTGKTGDPHFWQNLEDGLIGLLQVWQNIYPPEASSGPVCGP
jgi:hypothetical protein